MVISLWPWWSFDDIHDDVNDDKNLWWYQFIRINFSPGIVSLTMSSSQHWKKIIFNGCEYQLVGHVIKIIKITCHVIHCKCKTCFGCPRMVLCVPWKTLIFLQKLSLVRGDPPPPVWWIIRLFTWFFLWYLPLLQMLPSDTPTWQIWALIWTNLWKFCCSIGSVNPLLTQNYIFLRYQTNLFYMDRCITFQK